MALVCPTCHSSLERQDKYHLRCGACAEAFPILAGVPVLVEGHGALLNDWRLRAKGLLGQLEQEADAVRLELQQDARPSTQKRLNRLSQAYKEQHQLLSQLLKPLDVPKGSEELEQTLGTQLVRSQDVLSYYDNLFRDWCWGDDENRESARIVQGLVPPSHAEGPLVVYGAGGGRLAYDLHTGLGRETTYAFDINPLMLIAARRLLDGRNVQLYEFPLAPLGLADHAVKQKLRGVKEPSPGLELVLTDALRPCLAPGSVATIVTPWFIDILEIPFTTLARLVNRTLAPGGTWVNFGSLEFFHRSQSLRHSPEEITAILEESGFDVSLERLPAIPYLDSPHSAQTRHEQLLVFSARKQAEGPPFTLPPARPDWLRDTSLPVPPHPDLRRQVLANRLFIETVELIDGQRSVRAIAEATAPTFGLDPEAAEAVVCQVLEQLYGQQTKSRRFR